MPRRVVNPDDALARLRPLYDRILVEDDVHTVDITCIQCRDQRLDRLSPARSRAPSYGCRAFACGDQPLPCTTMIQCPRGGRVRM
jgi:hypothetical protein